MRKIPLKCTWRIFAVYFIGAVVSPAQEVKYIDLTAVRQRTELRIPPAPPDECNRGNCVGGGFGGGSIGDGAPDIRDPHALGVFLLSVSPTSINSDEPFQAEFKVQNTGRASIELPVSPHLSDLQPADAGEVFSYFSLALVVGFEGDAAGTYLPAVGFVELYGAPEHPDTMLLLKPGEWIRVKANVRLNSVPGESVSAKAHGTFWLRKTTFRPHPGGSFTETRNLYPNTTPTPSIPVQLVPLARSEQPNR